MTILKDGTANRSLEFTITISNSKHMKPILAIIILLSLLSCSNPSNQNNAQTSEEIKATLVQMWDAIEREDLERYASYVHDDFTQFGENDSTLRSGKEAEVAGVKSWMEHYDSIHTEMIEPIVTIKEDVAWLTYYWKDRSVKNGEHFSSRGKSTRLFVKENDKWLCIHGHYTSLP